MNSIKPIPGFDGYLISIDGRVFSEKSGKWLSPKTDRYGYIVFTLSKDGKSHCITAHRLVALAYIENSNGLPCVNHINEDKTDNRVENLEWVTVKQNDNYGTRNKRMAQAKCKKPVVQFTRGKEVAYAGVKDASRSTGIAHSQISKHCKDGFPTSDGSKWRYQNERNQVD